MSAARLYTPEVLALATSLSRYPFDESAQHIGSARSKSCGSTLRIALATDAGGRIAHVGLAAQACAIGQAAAAIFAGSARGRTLDRIRADEEHIVDWLAGSGAMPADIPGLAVIAPARDYPARHGAILLAWTAARELLPSDAASR